MSWVEVRKLTIDITTVNFERALLDAMASDPIRKDLINWVFRTNKLGLGLTLANYAGIDNAILKSLPDINAVAASEVAMNAIVASPAIINALVVSSAAMPVMANSQVAVNAMVPNSTVMTAVVASKEAMDAMAASTIAMAAIIADNTARAKMVASSIAMSSVAASSIAMTAIAASSITMTAIAANSTAMTTVAANSMAIGKVANSQVAVDAVVANNSAMSIVANYSAAVSAMAVSLMAMYAIINSNAARTQFVKSGTLQNYRNTIVATLERGVSQGKFQKFAAAMIDSEGDYAWGTGSRPNNCVAVLTHAGPYRTGESAYTSVRHLQDSSITVFTRQGSTRLEPVDNYICIGGLIHNESGDSYIQVNAYATLPEED